MQTDAPSILIKQASLTRCPRARLPSVWIRVAPRAIIVRCGAVRIGGVRRRDISAVAAGIARHAVIAGIRAGAVPLRKSSGRCENQAKRQKQRLHESIPIFNPGKQAHSSG